MSFIIVIICPLSHPPIQQPIIILPKYFHTWYHISSSSRLVGYAWFLACVGGSEAKEKRETVLMCITKERKPMGMRRGIKGKCTFVLLTIPCIPFPSYLSSPLLPVLRSATHSPPKVSLIFVLAWFDNPYFYVCDHGPKKAGKKMRNNSTPTRESLRAN